MKKRSSCRGKWLWPLAMFLATAPVFAQGWFPQSCPVQADLNGVEMLDGDLGWIVGGNGTILHTTNGGVDWQTQVSSTTYNLQGVSFLDSSFGLAVGDGGTILRTTNGGADWQVIRTDWIDGLRSVRMIDPTHACAVGTNAIFQPFVGRSTDGGLTWSFTSFYIQGNEGGLTGVEFTDAQNGFASAYLWDGRGAVCRTTNGGAAWTTVTVVAWALYGIDFPAPQVGVACGLAGNMLRSTDGGVSWNPQFIGQSRDLAAVSFPATSTGWVVGQVGWIARTTDGGAQWTPQSGGGGLALRGVDFVSPLVGTTVGASGTILRTDTGGDDPMGMADDRVGVQILPPSPNPFVQETAIRWRTADSEPGHLVICDAAGRAIRSLVLPPGNGSWRTFHWNGAGDDGRRAGAGVYFVRPQAGAGSVQKVVLLE